MVGLFLRSSWESDRVEDTGEYIEVTLDSGDWLESWVVNWHGILNLTVLAFLLVKVSVWIA